MFPQHSQFTCFETDAIEAHKVSDPFLHAILHASAAKSGHTNTTKQQKFKHMLKRLSMLQNLTKLSTSKQSLQLLFSLENYEGAKDKDIIELKWT
jgi:hypothetical protein